MKVIYFYLLCYSGTVESALENIKRRFCEASEKEENTGDVYSSGSYAPI